jgi:hypothetical protein
MASNVLPEPGPPATRTTRPLGRPPCTISSNPRMPVGVLTRDGRGRSCVIVSFFSRIFICYSLKQYDILIKIKHANTASCCLEIIEESPYPLSISHKLIECRQGQAILKAGHQMSQTAPEPGGRAAVELFEIPRLRVGLSRVFFERFRQGITKPSLHFLR